MSEKLKAACDRVIDRDRPHEDYWTQADHDDYAIAVSLRARLTADEQYAKDDAEPLDREWFNENGNDLSSVIVCHGATEYEIESACGNPSVGVDITVHTPFAFNTLHVPCVTTRGQLRKLLEALKGGERWTA